MYLNQNKKKYSLCVIPYLPFVLDHKSKITIAKSKQFDDFPLEIFTLFILKEQVSNFKVRDTQNKLKELYEEKGKDEYIKTFFDTQLNHAMNYLYPITLDESIFLFIDASKCIKPKNCARTKRNLIKRSRKNDLKKESYFLSIMITWQVLYLFSLMLNAKYSISCYFP